MTFYQHTQVGTAMLAVLAAAVAVFIIVSPSSQSGFAFPWMAPILATVALLFGWLTVTIDDESLVCRFGLGLIRKRFALRDIEEAEAVRNRWYYGWGIRLTPYGWLFNVSGLDAVQIRMSNGKTYRIGTNEPTRLLSAIQQHALLRT